MRSAISKRPPSEVAEETREALAQPPGVVEVTDTGVRSLGVESRAGVYISDEA
jgi:hypothetical protein